MEFSSGNLRAAVGSYEQALRLHPDFALAHHNLGIVLQHLRDWPRAQSCFERAIYLLLTCAPAFNGLGIALKEQGKLAHALEAFQRAVALEPENAGFAYNLGSTLHEAGELNSAVACYRTALRLDPAFADASNNLATALKELGLLAEAISQLRETLKHQPDHATAYYSLSDFAADGRYQFTSDELERMKRILTSGRCSASERSLCCFALGTALHQQGSYDEAFRYYQLANDLRKRLLRERKIVFDAKRHGAMVDGIIDQCNHSYFESTTGWGTDADSLIFIVGMPRSGSTLVEQILASHPRVFGAGEIGDIHQLLTGFASDGNSHASPLLSDRGAAGALAAVYVRRLTELGRGAERVIVKTLQNYLHLGVIATLFPRARIIHCRRDPLDVCLSCYFTNFQVNDFSWSLEDIGAYYRAYDKLMAHWARVLPTQIHDLCYEDLVHDQEAVSRRLLAYCGLEWDERCVDFFKTRRVVRTASKIQVRKPMSAQAIGRWKHYRAHLGPLFQALGRPVECMGLAPYRSEVACGGGVNLPAAS